VADSHLDLRISSDTLTQRSTRILNSWKEIATYLGRGVRTIQRYEEELGLPIHRPAARERSAVLAFADELERWLRNTPRRKGRRSNPTNGNSSNVMEPQEIQIKDDLRSQLERAKQKMEQAQAEYGRALENYNALKRRVENAEAASLNGKRKRAG
jgi:DNA repair exonuclease SbcCD ATPase subunit